MSTYRNQPIPCTCGLTFEGVVFDGLHVSRRPDVREQILDGTFHRHSCPGCGAAMVVENRLAYTDFPRRHWFTVHPRIDLRHRDELAAFAHRSFEMTMLENAPDMVRAWAGEMTHRLVFGLASLREKLVVFEAGLDDRLIECLKLQLGQHTGLVLHADTYLHVCAVEADTLLFEYAPPGQVPRSLEVPRELYVALELERATLYDHVPWFHDDLVVDYRTLLAPSVTLAPAQVA